MARGRRGAMWTGVGFGFSEACMYLSFALAFWFGARLTVRGVCSFEDTLWSTQAIFFGMMMVRLSFFFHFYASLALSLF